MRQVKSGTKRELNQSKGRSDDGKLRQVFYKSARWRELRAKHLKAMPYCEKCLEETGTWNKRDVIVDHIGGHDRPDWLARFWDPSVLQTLCSRHHNQKTARETPNKGFAAKLPSRMSATERLRIRRKLSETT